MFGALCIALLTVIKKYPRDIFGQYVLFLEFEGVVLNDGTPVGNAKIVQEISLLELKR